MTWSHFPCPHCGAQYKVVEAEAGPETVDRELTWIARGGPRREA
jgi:hypothetical protein